MFNFMFITKQINGLRIVVGKEREQIKVSKKFNETLGVLLKLLGKFL